ncbi:MAG: hypothetical protein N2376_07800 [Clostridia bacterium]|nr:hypothetical protein [Clostridia bacterium]
MNIQMIDEFRRRTNATYDEAKFYLERYHEDLLEAIIAFEKDRTGYQQQKQNTYQYQNRHDPKTERPHHSGNFGRGVMRVLQRLIDLKLVITDKNLRSFPIPVIVPVVLFPVWHIIIIMAVAMMIMGFKFHIQEMPDPNVNVESMVSKMKDKVRESSKSY